MVFLNFSGDFASYSHLSLIVKCFKKKNLEILATRVSQGITNSCSVSVKRVHFEVFFWFPALGSLLVKDWLRERRWKTNLLRSRFHPYILASSSRVLVIINRNYRNMIWVNLQHKYYKPWNKPPSHISFFKDSFPPLNQCSLKSGNHIHTWKCIWI